MYDVVSGKKRAERKRIEKEEIEQRKKIWKLGKTNSLML